MDSHPASLNERNDRLIQSSCITKVSATENVPPKAKGRRRLVKLSSSIIEPESHEQIEPPSFDFDFDSPDKTPQIRDILNELSARLDSLTIEKKKDSLESVPACDLASESSTTGTKSRSDVPFDLDSLEVGNGLDKPGDFIPPSPSSDEDDCIVLSGNKVDAFVNLNQAEYVKRPHRDIKDILNEVHLDLEDDNGEKEANSLEDDRDPGEDPIRFVKAGLEYILPGKVAKILFPHQKEALQWLWSLHCMQTGGILGDDMGLGKTMQIAAFLSGLFNSRLIKRALIVAPKTLLTHWIKELTVVGLSDRIKEFFSPCQKTRQYELNYILQDNGILLTTYDIVRNNSKALQGKFYHGSDEFEDGILWDYVVLDEGHIIKNPSTQRAKSLLEILSKHRIIITGTPLQNNLKELWALFNFCCPQVLGDKLGFKERYERPILHGNDKIASEREKIIGSQVAKELRECIKPYFLRRLKHEVSLESSSNGCASLSKKHEMIVWLKLSKCQRRLYEAFMKSEMVLSSFDGSPLAALTILKKICDHPLLLTKRAAEDVLEGLDSMVTTDDLDKEEEMAYNIAKMASLEDYLEEAENVSCKITFLVSLLDNLLKNGHTVLVFSQTRKMLNLIQDAIRSIGYTFLRIDGTTKILDRQRIVDEFQSGGGPPIFLLTSKVGGLGLTLTNADRVIMVDPAWNPSTDNQSVDRAYRIGQKKDVIVYRLITCGTIEEKIYKMQVFKGGLFRSATEHREQMRYFSQRDLRELFTLPPQGFDVSLTRKQLVEEHGHVPIEDSVKSHMGFLESLDIAGVSHHSLLFSKDSSTQPLNRDNALRPLAYDNRIHQSANGSSSDMCFDVAAFAFNPKDMCWKSNENIRTNGSGIEGQMQIKLQNLLQTLGNKAVIEKLPDKGEKILRQIQQLNVELEDIRKNVKSKFTEVVELDNVTERIPRISF